MADVSQTRLTQLLTRETAGTRDTPVELPQRLRPPLAFSPLPRTWRIILFIGMETLLSLRAEVSGQLTVGRADPDEGYVPAVDLGPFGAQDAGVSRHHALIFSAEGGLYIRDLDSTNGTRINGFELEPNQSYKLHEGDRLEFGHLGTQFHVISGPA